MDHKLKANIQMSVAKLFGGLNMNALKYLIPIWMAPITGVFIRTSFGAIAFWIIGLFIKGEPKTDRLIKFKAFLLGAICISGFMSTFLTGLKYTTPVSSSILLSLGPIWVFIISLIYYDEKLTWSKGIGLLIGFGGALLSMCSKKAASIAIDPVYGDILTIISSFCFSLYLIFSQQLLKKCGPITLTKWTFLGAAFSSFILNMFVGWDAKVFETPYSVIPIMALLFVLIFPTVITYFLQLLALRYLPSTVISMYGYEIIAVATVVALITGQDKFEWIMVASIVLLVIGLFLVERGEKKAPPSPINLPGESVKQ